MSTIVKQEHLDQYQKTIADLKKFVQNSAEGKLWGYCQVLKNDVHFATEKRILELHEQRDKTIEQIEEYERERMDFLKKEKESNQRSDVDDLIKRMDKYGNEFREEEALIEMALERLLVVQKEGDKLLTDLDKLIFGSKKWQFKANKERISAGLLGKLISNKKRSITIYDKVEVRRILGDEKKYDKLRTVVQLEDGRIATGGEFDGRIDIWDSSSSGNLVRTLTEHTDLVGSLVQLQDGQLASASFDKTIRFWNTDTGCCNKILKEHITAVTSLVILGDGRLVSGCLNNTIKIWNTGSGLCIRTLNGHGFGGVTSLALLEDGNVACGSGDYTIKVLNIGSGRCIRRLKGHTDSIMSLVVLGNGRLASGSIDKTIKIWDTCSGACIKTLEGDERHRILYYEYI